MTTTENSVRRAPGPATGTGRGRWIMLAVLLAVVTFPAAIIAYVVATMVTFVGNRHWAFKHRKGKGLRHETMLFVALNCVGIVIQVGIVDLAYYELGYKSGLAYNLATIIGIGLATLFRLYAYRRFVFNNHQVEEAAELASALRRQAVPLTTLFWTGTGDRLNHEYQFNFNLPQARTAFQRTLAFLTATAGR